MKRLRTAQSTALRAIQASSLRTLARPRVLRAKLALISPMPPLLLAFSVRLAEFRPVIRRSIASLARRLVSVSWRQIPECQNVYAAMQIQM
jgi:hypothetical protein